MTAEQSFEELWSNLEQHAHAHGSASTSWPSYDEVLHNIRNSDYEETLSCPFDMRPMAPPKVLCPYGVVGCVELELFRGDQALPTSRNAAFTGFLAPGQTYKRCILRLSSAMKPPGSDVTSKWGRALLAATTSEKIRTAQLYPTAALKVFCDEHRRNSGNLLFAGAKIGQADPNYFAHCLATQFTEDMPRLMRPLVRKFWKYSDTPFALGLSDFCRCGDETPRFPYCVIIRPVYKPESTPSLDFISDLQSIPVGTVLYDVFACPTPFAVGDARQLQRIGRITTLTKMLPNGPSSPLFFKHQRKEEDLNLRPDWKAFLGQKTKIKVEGKGVGTIHQMAGWRLFESQISEGVYLDNERGDV